MEKLAGAVETSSGAMETFNYAHFVLNVAPRNTSAATPSLTASETPAPANGITCPSRNRRLLKHERLGVNLWPGGQGARLLVGVAEAEQGGFRPVRALQLESDGQAFG